MKAVYLAMSLRETWQYSAHTSHLTLITAFVLCGLSRKTLLGAALGPERL